MARTSRSSIEHAGKRGGSSFASLSRWKNDRAQTREQIELFLDYEDSGLAWFWATDAAGNLTYISHQAAGSLQSDVDFLVGKPLNTLVDLKTVSETDITADAPTGRNVDFLIRAKNTFTNKEVRTRLGDEEAWWSISGRPQFDANGNFSGYRGNASDVTVERRELADTARLSQYDSLTGLANRLRMSTRLQIVLTGYKVANRPCSLMMLDLDRFKHINDTLGHPTGDALLQQVAQRLQRIVGSKGEIGRLGGDEFQIFIPDEDDRSELGSLASHIIQMLSQPYLIEGNSCVIGASVGIAIAPFDGEDVDDLVRSADLALYSAKAGGRGQFRFYSSDLHSKAEERRMIENELRRAIPQGQLELHYQPLTCPKTNRVKSFEALLRWNHPERGWISPHTVISVAEETGLIIPLGEWALRQACDDASKWPDDIRVAVNVSPVQFMTENLPGVVASALANSGLDPHRLELEITESVFLGDSEGTTSRFKTLKELGIRFALDDFGTGYSSLGYLRDAPFDKIKIDQSFIRGAVDNSVRGNAAIITAIVGLAESLGMETTAEGIEAMDELDFVRKQGVTSVQGYVYGKATPNDTVLGMVKRKIIKLTPEGPSRTRANRRTVLRKIDLIHEGHSYLVTMRDLSQTGARVQGLCDVPVGTRFVVSFGDGQTVGAKVRRAVDDWLGLEFEEPLVSDGGGDWCTRQRSSAQDVTPDENDEATKPANGKKKRASLRKKPAKSNSGPKFRLASASND
ncbi:MAG: EAL domain-containing protein [Erythrobacter sp.]